MLMLCVQYFESKDLPTFIMPCPQVSEEGGHSMGVTNCPTLTRTVLHYVDRIVLS